MTVDFNQLMDEAEAAFNQAEVQENQGGDDFPDGSYHWAIEKAELVTVKSGQNQGKPQVQWWLRVIDGPKGTHNRVVFHYHQLYGADAEKMAKAMSRLKTDLSRIGYGIASLKELQGVLGAAVGTHIKGSLKTGQTGIQNCYFNAPVK